MSSLGRLIVLFQCWVAVLGISPSSAIEAEPSRKPVPLIARNPSGRRHHSKWETSCAAAALATVLTFSHNDPVSEKLVAQGMLRGTDPIEVKAAVDLPPGHEALRGDPRLKGIADKGLTIQGLLALDSPIVPISFYGNPHFVVVRGLDVAGEVHLADPAFGNYSISVEGFLDVWREGMAFVVVQ